MNISKLAKALRMAADALDEESPATSTPVRDVAVYSSRDLPPDAKSSDSFHAYVRRNLADKSWKLGQVVFVNRSDWEIARSAPRRSTANVESVSDLVAETLRINGLRAIEASEEASREVIRRYTKD